MLRAVWHFNFYQRIMWIFVLILIACGEVLVLGISWVSYGKFCDYFLWRKLMVG
jgi:hypothetical protein